MWHSECIPLNQVSSWQSTVSHLFFQVLPHLLVGSSHLVFLTVSLACKSKTKGIVQRLRWCDTQASQASTGSLPFHVNMPHAFPWTVSSAYLPLFTFCLTRVTSQWQPSSTRQDCSAHYRKVLARAAGRDRPARRHASTPSDKTSCRHHNRGTSVQAARTTSGPSWGDRRAIMRRFRH